MKYLVFLIWLLIAIYLSWPSQGFPDQLPDSVQSDEPADIESVYRRSYYTNTVRHEVMDHYYQAFGGGAIRLNHPPEEAQSLIRDQARSSYLEEFVHPGREVLYVNGYVPTKAHDFHYFKGVKYDNKVTVRYIPSHPISRLTVLLLVSGIAYLLAKEYGLVKR